MYVKKSWIDRYVLTTGINADLCVIKGDLLTLYIMNNFVTNKSKLPQDGAQVFPYMG